MRTMHFRPARNWMNDPNGLVFHDGRYHLYFQYNPEGATHGFMSWGHASSPDLVRWEEHPVAIRYTDTHEIFSGSVVFDEHDTSGLGAPGNPPLVAVFTLADQDARHQAQGIASSLDGGETWRLYEGNPVLDRGSADFRDPKVFRYAGEAGEYWVMVAVEAVERRVVLYRSDDLRTWTHLSDYGPSGATGGVWECPDLFPLAVDGDPSEVRWVLLISLNPGGIAGGSGTQYVIGSFDGVGFTPDESMPPAAPLEACDWLDHGRDCYAGVTFSGLPGEERILLAWMSNWDYAGRLPVDAEAPQRGAMTLARRLSLVRTEGRVRLRQEPIGPETITVAALAEVRADAPVELIEELPERCRVDLSIRLEGADGFWLDLGGTVILEYSTDSGLLRLDRRPADDAMPDGFGSVEEVRIVTRERVELVIWLDRDAIELFASGGTRTITDLLPERVGGGASIAGRDGSVLLERFEVSAVRDLVGIGRTADTKGRMA
jgi:fructan beta-fructosidase